jgi:hypothetical protein
MSNVNKELSGFNPVKIGSEHLQDSRLRKVKNKTQLAEYYGWGLNKLRKELEDIQHDVDFDLLNRRTFTTGRILIIAEKLGLPNGFDEEI